MARSFQHGSAPSSAVGHHPFGRRCAAGLSPKAARRARGPGCGITAPAMQALAGCHLLHGADGKAGGRSDQRQTPRRLAGRIKSTVPAGPDDLVLHKAKMAVIGGSGTAGLMVAQRARPRAGSAGRMNLAVDLRGEDRRRSRSGRRAAGIDPVWPRLPPVRMLTGKTLFPMRNLSQTREQFSKFRIYS